MTDTAPPEHPAPSGEAGPDREPSGGSGGPTGSATPSAAGHPGRRRAVIVATGLAVVVAVGVAVLVTRDEGQETTTPETSTPTVTTAPPAAGPTTTPSSGPVTTAPATTTTVAAQLEDGRHPVYLTVLDVPGRTVEFDLVQFLTGDEADAAFQRDHPDETGGVPNDYYIVNENPRLRTLPVARDVEVTVVQTPTSANSPHAIAFEDLPDYLAGDPMPDDERLWPNPFWLSVEDGTVVAIAEQYTP